MKPAASRGATAVASPDVFAAFYDSTVADVYRYLLRAVLGNRALAEDLTQETFASVVLAVRDGRAEAYALPWVIGVARHKLVDHYRNAARERRRLALAWSSGVGRDDQQLDDLDEVDLARAAQLLHTLAPDHQLVLVLRYLDELSVDEIAADMERSVHATESLLVRARQALARSLRENPS
jgi:RNA polymerase sigma-70 factor (ECF subfamily)